MEQRVRSPSLYLSLLIGLGLPDPAWAQQNPPVAPAPRVLTAAPYGVARAASPVEVDGALDEVAWQRATVLPLAFEWLPGDNITPPVRTDALLTYDDDNVYVAFRAHDPNPGEIRAHLMDRDAVDTLVQDDHVVIIVDCFNDERRSFQFRVNPLGVQADAIFSDIDGVEDFSWDAIWDSAGRITEDGYTIEVAIPLTQLRFPRGTSIQTWGFDLGRSYPRSVRHRISTAPRDRNRNCVLCQANKVTGFENLKPGRNIELDPTVTAIRTDSRPEPSADLQKENQDLDPGLTAKWGIAPSLTLNAAINPDFSQVEADVAQLEVNERFALFYPEKRPFFLEGLDYFTTLINAVFTRTVVDPVWGGKLTGKSGRNLAGVFVTRDESNSLVFPSSQASSSALLEDDVTASVLRYRRDIGAGSTLGVLYTGREAAGYHNRVGGIDGFFRLSNTDDVRFQYLWSDTAYPDAVVAEYGQPAGAFGAGAISALYQHASREWYWAAGYDDFGREFRADSGFVPQVDIRNLSGQIARVFWGTRDDWYTQVNLGGAAWRVEDHSGQLIEQVVRVNGSIQAQMQTAVGGSWSRTTQYYAGVLYEGLPRVGFNAQVQPSGMIRLSINGNAGGAIDFTNRRRADQIQLQPTVELKLGRHVNLQADHTLRTLSADGTRIFRADLTQLRLFYHFNVRSFVRAIVQYQDLDRNQVMYTVPVTTDSRTMFTQFLFSYKLNPQTVLFLGYSDDRLGMADDPLSQTGRTFFLKVGYAWLK
jgi:hypothetical protein